MKKIQHQAQKKVELVNQKVTQMLHSVQRLVHVLIGPFVRIALDIRQKYRDIRERTYGGVKKFTAKLKSTLRLPGLIFSPRLNLNRLKRSFIDIKEKFSEGKEKISLTVQQGIQWVKESSQIFLGWGQLQFQRINEQVLTLTTKWKSAFQSSQKRSEKATDWVFNQLKKGARFLKRQLNPCLNFYQRQWLPKWQVVSGYCKTRWDQAGDLFQNGHKQALLFLQVRQEKMKQLSSERLINYITSQGWLAKLPLFFQNWLRRGLSHPFVRRFIELGFKCSTLFANSLLYTAKFLLQTLSCSGVVLRKGSEGLRSGTKNFFKTVVESSKSALGMLHKLAFNVLYYFLLFLTMNFIVCKWGMYLLRDCVSTLFRKINSVSVK